MRAVQFETVSAYWLKALVARVWWPCLHGGSPTAWRGDRSRDQMPEP